MVDQQKKTQDEKIAEGFNQPNNTAQSPLVRSAGTAPQPMGQAPVSGPKPASSGQFTNVRNFLGANVGAGERLASKTAEGVQRGVGQATQQVGQFGQKIGQAVGQEEQRVSQADQVRAGIEAITKPQQTQQQGMNLMSQGQDFDAARQLITGQTNVADIIQQKQQLGAQAQSGLTQAGQQVGQLGSESGRFNLLRRAVGGPMYSRGMSGLDNLLLSTEGGATLAQAQRQAGAELGQAGSQLGTQIDQFGNRLSTVGTQAQEASKMLQDQLQAGKTTVNKELDEQFQRVNQDVTREADILNRVLSGTANLSDQQTQQLLEQNNLNNILNQRLYGMDVRNYFQGPQAVDRNALVTQDQAAKMSALQRLAGLSDAELLQAGGKTAEDFRARINAEELLADRAKKEQQVKDMLAGRTVTGQGVHSHDAGWGIRSEARSQVAQNAARALFGNQGSEFSSGSNTVDLTNDPMKFAGLGPAIVQNIFGGGADANRARQLAEMDYQRNLENLMREIQFNDTLAQRNRRV